MNKKQWMLVWAIGLLFLSGCATARSIYMNSAIIDYSDGVNLQEAKWIAQKYCLEVGIKDAFISYPEVQEFFFKPELWEVTFRIKDLNQLSYHYKLFIDKKTGEVIDFTYEE